MQRAVIVAGVVTVGRGVEGEIRVQWIRRVPIMMVMMISLMEYDRFCCYCCCGVLLPILLLYLHIWVLFLSYLYLLLLL